MLMMCTLRFTVGSFEGQMQWANWLRLLLSTPNGSSRPVDAELRLIVSLRHPAVLRPVRPAIGPPSLSRTGSRCHDHDQPASQSHADESAAEQLISQSSALDWILIVPGSVTEYETDGLLY